MEDSDLELPENFGNEVSLFPLPEVVLFPGVVQAFHIFEPRYKQMTRDSLETDRLIALAMLKPEPPSLASPVSQMICIGKIIADVRLSDGRYNLLVGGVARARIEEEVCTNKLYRRAKVSIPRETNLDSPGFVKMRAEITDIFQRLIEGRGHQHDEIKESILRPDLNFSRFLDLIAFLSDAPAELKQRVLETVDLEQRGVEVLRMLHSLQQSIQASPTMLDFPPGFSLN